MKGRLHLEEAPPTSASWMSIEQWSCLWLPILNRCSGNDEWLGAHRSSIGITVQIDQAKSSGTAAEASGKAKVTHPLNTALEYAIRAYRERVEVVHVLASWPFRKREHCHSEREAGSFSPRP